MASITITLDEQEQAAFKQLLDIALRQSGMGALDVAAHFKVKLDQASVPPAPEETVSANQD